MIMLTSKNFKAIFFVFVFSSITLLLLQVKSFAFTGNQKDSIVQQLQNEKTIQEIEKLRVENKNLNSFWGKLSSYSIFITSFIAIIGVFITIYKLINERSLDRKQREEESFRRSNENFNIIITNLGSKSEPIQASAAISILTFLKREYIEFQEQVFMILLANLKIKHSEAIYNLLIEGFEKAVRLQLPLLKQKNKKYEIDLSRTYMYRINLAGCDLGYADLGFAKLKYANFSNSKTSLYRARGIEADLEKARLSEANMQEARFAKAKFMSAYFHKTNLVSAVLKEANLSNAQFYQAQMQSAHLEGAVLHGAKFEQANINDAFFKNAKFNDVALKSILNTKDKSWKKAHFEKVIVDKLEKMDGLRHR